MSIQSHGNIDKQARTAYRDGLLYLSTQVAQSPGLQAHQQPLDAVLQLSHRRQSVGSLGICAYNITGKMDPLNKTEQACTERTEAVGLRLSSLLTDGGLVDVSALQQHKAILQLRPGCRLNVLHKSIFTHRALQLALMRLD